MNCETFLRIYKVKANRGSYRSWKMQLQRHKTLHISIMHATSSLFQLLAHNMGYARILHYKLISKFKRILIVLFIIG
jgi:hypothetical protein